MHREGLYGNSCTAGLRYTIDRVKEDIDAYRDVTPEPGEDYWAYHSTYRGIEISVWMPGSIAYGAWIEGDWIARAKLTALKTLIDESIDEPPADGNGTKALGGLGLLVLLYLIFIRGK